MLGQTLICRHFRVCFCLTSKMIRQTQSVIVTDDLFFQQHKATPICGNQLLPSQGQTDVHCKMQH